MLLSQSHSQTRSFWGSLSRPGYSEVPEWAGALVPKQPESSGSQALLRMKIKTALLGSLCPWSSLVAQRKQIRLISSLSGLRIQPHSVRCGVGCRHGSDPTRLWLWRRPAAVALIRPLAWELPYAAGAALKNKKQNNNNKKDPCAQDIPTLGKSECLRVGARQQYCSVCQVFPGHSKGWEPLSWSFQGRGSELGRPECCPRSRSFPRGRPGVNSSVFWE